MSLNNQILIASLMGLGLGLLLKQAGGMDSQWFQSALYLTDLVSSVFISLLKMLLVPLIFSSIAIGVANLSAHSHLQRVWKITVGFFALSMLLAILQGLVAANLFEPGKGLEHALFQDNVMKHHPESLSFSVFITRFVGELFVNPFKALAEANILAIVIFALFVGAGLVAGKGKYRTLHHLLDETHDMMLLLLGWVMHLAPYGIMALLIRLIASQDTAILGQLLLFVAVVIATTLIHGLIVLPGILWILTGKNPFAFFGAVREALMTAFATSSSSATLPISLRCAKQNLAVDPAIAGFVVPLGATVNMDGTALYEAAAALFISNLVGIELDLGHQMIVCFTAMIAAIGAPGIPSAGMVTMVMVLQSVGLPAEAIAILLPIDRLLDTFRTMVNVEGDLITSVLVDHRIHHQS